MTEASRPRRSRILAAGGLLLLLTCVWGAPTLTRGALPPLALWNTSPSVPTGLYLYRHHLDAARPPERGDFVAVRYPAHFDLPWLLKRVEGVPGDRFCWDEAAGTHRLDGRLMPPPDPEATDLGIPVWKGCATLGPDEVVLYGETPDSYDSRYFGVVTIGSLWGLYRPAWTGP